MIKNKLNFRIIILFIFFSNSFYSQNIDDLKLKLINTTEDSTKVIFLLNEICPYYLGHGIPKEAIPFVEEASKLAEKLNFTKGQIQSLVIQGDIYGEIGEIDKGVNCLNKALELAKKNPLKPSNLAVIYFNIGNMHNRKSNLAQALENYFMTIEILDKNNIINYPFRGTILRNIAIIYKTNKQYNKSIQYSFNAINIFNKTNDSLSLCGTYSNLGSAYYDNIDYKNALKYYSKGLYIAKKVKRISSICTNITGIGLVYQSLKNYPKALFYHSESLKISQKNNLKSHTANAFCNIGIDYHGLKEYDKSNKYLNESLILAKEIGDLDLQKKIYAFQSKFYEAQNLDSKALDLLKKQNILNDSIFNDKNAKQINELSVKFETAKKEKKIIVLNANLLSKKKDEIILQSKIQKRNVIIFGTIIGSILLMITIILLYNRRRLLLKNLHQLEINQQRDNTTASIVRAQEKEQTRIAKDLHDSIGTFLSTLKINLQLYEDAIPTDKTEGYLNALNLIDKISVELRNIMKNLASETLQEHGLVKGYEELIQRISELEIITVDFHTNGLTERVDEVIEHNLYRIAQELLNNCIKHSKAEHATIQLIADDNTITLMFEDDGVGFDVNSPLLKNKNHGMGLKNIYNRVNFIKGTIHIESSPENGSSFIIEVPKK